MQIICYDSRLALHIDMLMSTVRMPLKNRNALKRQKPRKMQNKVGS